MLAASSASVVRLNCGATAGGAKADNHDIGVVMLGWFGCHIGTVLAALHCARQEV